MAGDQGAHRAAWGNRSLVRYTASHLSAVNAEWAVFIALLVYTYDRSGARATGLASLAMLLPYVIAAPYAGHFAERYRPSHVRFTGSRRIDDRLRIVVARRVSGTPRVGGPCSAR